MNSRFDFKLTPAYSLYYGAAVLEQNGSNIKFLLENKKDSVLCGQLKNAFFNHLQRVSKIKDCPENYKNLPSVEFIKGTHRQLKDCVSKLYKKELKIAKNWRAADSVSLKTYLNRQKLPPSIESLGFNSEQCEKLRQIVAKKCGLILVCGGASSGKSTTIASLFAEIEKAAYGSKKIINFEKAFDYLIPCVAQAKIDVEKEFSDNLNQNFKQEPDVIMIGEICDKQSAAAAIRSCLTGYLVFATLNAGSFEEAVLQLEILGIERNLLFQVILGTICQGLNYIGCEIRLYADVVLPAKNLQKVVLDSELESCMEHFTNYSELLQATKNLLLGKNPNEKKSAVKKSRRERVPLYKKYISGRKVYES